MDDLGAPISYLMLDKGARVYSSDGEKLGEVVEVRADTQKDIFDGIVIGNPLLPGGKRLVVADQVDEIFERGVLLTIDSAAAEALPEPG
jgi:sporulation protein YlmC with PRC-barrel domain